MISFTELTQDNISETAEAVSHLFEPGEGREIYRVADSLLDLINDPDITVGITAAYGCILVRICDFGRYSFVYPIPDSATADIGLAIDAVRRYAIKEELPLVFTDVPKEDVGSLVSFFRHVNVDAEDAEALTYRAEVRSEGELLDEIPETDEYGITLAPLSEEDIVPYARLSRSEEVNRYWGYDYREDAPDASDAYFFETALSDMRRGSAITYSVKLDGEFLGEAVIYGFDFSGGAEIGFRLLPEYWGRGIGERVFSSLVLLAERIGLVRIFASVMEENLRSVKLLSRLMERSGCENGRVHYTLSLYQ